MRLEGLQAVLQRARSASLVPRSAGRVCAVRGGLILARGLRLGVGGICRVSTPAGWLLAEVVALDTDGHQLAPLGHTLGLTPGSQVIPLPAGIRVPPAGELLGLVVDALGRPIEDPGRPLLRAGRSVHDRPTPSICARRPIEEPLVTGVAAVDGLLTIGRGQRVGIFAGSGVGKSTLLAALAQEAQADAVVFVLVGERGREVSELHASLTPAAKARTVIVAATSDEPAALRILAPATGIALAEDLRDRGQDVLLVVDSITRFALAAREVGITAGEPPSARGFPPSVFARLPQLLERLGRVGPGSITGLLTVLVEGDRIEDDPVADALRGLLDGHLVLSRELAERGHYPAIDVPASISRTMPHVTSPEHRSAAGRVRVLCSALRRAEELREIGALRAGADPTLDEAMAKGDALRAFLLQATDETREFDQTVSAVAELARPPQPEGTPR